MQTLLSQPKLALPAPPIHITRERGHNADSAVLPKSGRPDVSHFDGLPDAAVISVKALAVVLDQGISTVWRKCLMEPDFPQPIRLGPGCTRFNVGHIRTYLAAKADKSAKPKRSKRLKGQAVARLVTVDSRATLAGEAA